MAQIQLLPDDVINKIAAGEVVERPASVVKELVENALDAGASRVSIELERGGIERITVQDNGAGIAAEEVPLAFTRHATSKIKKVDDLFSVASKGFRGEALASIAAVSRVTVQSQKADAATGVKCSVEGGEMGAVLPWSGSTGTSITIRDLFFNVPVRAKFLKNAATEWAHCLEWIQALSLVHPQVTFAVSHNGKELFRASSIVTSDESCVEAQMRQRMAAIIGEGPAEKLVFFNLAHELGTWQGLASPPGFDKGSGRLIFLFVNGRWVKDRGLRYAVQRGYQSHLLKGRYPIVLALLNCDPSLVDVNVHPAKTEVRLQYASEVQAQLAHAIRRTMRQGAWASPQASAAASTPIADLGTRPSEPPPGAAAFQRSPPPAVVRETLIARAEASFPRAPTKSEHRPSAVARLQNRGQAQPTPFPEFDEFSTVGGSTQSEIKSSEARSASVARGRVTSEPIPWADLAFIGSFARCYLLFEDGDRLLVVDQHAFHERIIYERLVRDQSMLKRSQPLVVPECCQVPPVVAARLQEFEDRFRALGFDFKVLTDGMIEVRAVPSLLEKIDVAALLESWAGFEQLNAVAADYQSIHQDILATMACHAAVRAGEELAAEEVHRLVREAHDVDFYLNCPHGRPVFKWWTQGEVARWFDR